jgi:hypothetical protein
MARPDFDALLTALATAVDESSKKHLRRAGANSDDVAGEFDAVLCLSLSLAKIVCVHAPLVATLPMCDMIITQYTTPFKSQRVYVDTDYLIAFATTLSTLFSSLSPHASARLPPPESPTPSSPTHATCSASTPSVAIRSARAHAGLAFRLRGAVATGARDRTRISRFVRSSAFSFTLLSVLYMSH